ASAGVVEIAQRAARAAVQGLRAAAGEIDAASPRGDGHAVAESHGVDKGHGLVAGREIAFDQGRAIGAGVALRADAADRAEVDVTAGARAVVVDGYGTSRHRLQRDRPAVSVSQAGTVAQLHGERTRSRIDVGTRGHADDRAARVTITVHHAVGLWI